MKELPFVSFVHLAGVASVPVPASVSQGSIDEAAGRDDHFYLAAHPTWVRASWSELYATLARAVAPFGAVPTSVTTAL